jgi:hypothetical protein
MRCHLNSGAVISSPVALQISDWLLLIISEGQAMLRFFAAGYVI